MHARFAALPFALLALPALAAGWSCDQLKREIKATYGFQPSKLSEKEQDAKSAQMDAIWQAVQAQRTELAPCLRTMLLQATDDTWFLFDGAQLLASVDPSQETKRILLDALARVPLDDVDLRTWVHLAASLGFEGFDTSALGKRWLAYARAEYFLPEHAAFRVDRRTGALFIFGAMDEKFAAPVLQELAAKSSGEQKAIASALLPKEGSPIEPRPKPRTSRAQFIAAFNALLQGDRKPFDALMEAVPDGERDLVAVATEEDLPLLRKVRRYYASTTSPHAIDYYDQFTLIIQTVEGRTHSSAPH